MSRQEIKKLLHNIDFQADSFLQESSSKGLQILINLVEKLSEENEQLKIEIQKLRDENKADLKENRANRKSVAKKEVAKAKTYPRKKTESNEKEKRKKIRRSKRKISQLIGPKYVKSTPPYYPLMPNTEDMNLSLYKKF